MDREQQRAAEIERTAAALAIIGGRIIRCDRTDFNRMMGLQIEYARLDGFLKGLSL